MAIVDLDFRTWLSAFRTMNPELFNGKRGLSERMAEDIAQHAFAAGKAAARSAMTPATPAGKGQP